jgi:RNA polymerase sigma factor (sigma-70 family)
MEILMEKYKKIFGYANTVIFTYLKSGKNLDCFRRISMDYDDIKQEVAIKLFEVLKIYEKKYKNEKKMNLKIYVGKIIPLILQNILRDNEHKIFVPIEQDLQENEDSLIEKIKNNSTEDKTELIHPDLIPTTPHKNNLSIQEITQILHSVSANHTDYQVLKLKIIDNYTLEEIAKKLGLKNKQAVKVKLDKGCKKLRTKYKHLIQLFI